MKNFILLIFSLFAFSVSAQENPGTTKSLFSVNFLLPGLEYETAVSEKATVDLRLSTGFGYASGMYRETSFGIFPEFRAQYRHYYNFGRRLRKEKNIDNNSANYLALHTAVASGKPIIGDLEQPEDILGVVGPVWGMQRVYNSGFKLDLSLGAGYGFSDEESYISPIIGFSLGWLLAN